MKHCQSSSNIRSNNSVLNILRFQIACVQELIDPPKCAILCLEEPVHFGSETGSTVLIAKQCLLLLAWYQILENFHVHRILLMKFYENPQWLSRYASSRLRSFYSTVAVGK